MFFYPLIRTSIGFGWPRTLCLKWAFCIYSLLSQLRWDPLVLWRLIILLLLLFFGLVLLVLHNGRQFIHWHLIELSFGQRFDQILCGLILLCILTSLEDDITLVAQLVEGRYQILRSHLHSVVLIRSNVVWNHLYFTLAALLEPLDFLALLGLGELGYVPSVVVSQPQEGRLVPICLQAVEILVVALLEDLVAVGLVVQHLLPFKSLSPCLLLVEDLLDLGLIHVNVCEVHLFFLQIL